jgi:uncharacterized protein
LLRNSVASRLPLSPQQCGGFSQAIAGSAGWRLTMTGNGQSESFLELGRLGNNEWWRYLLGFLLILGSYLVGNVICLGTLVVANGGMHFSVDRAGRLAGLNPIVFFVSMHSVFVCLLLGTWLAVRFLNRRPFLSLITCAKRVNLRPVLFGFAVWTGLDALYLLAAWLIFPGSYQFTLRLPQFLYFIPLVLLLTPIQSLAEEIIFRGYLLQAFGSVVRNPWLAATVNGVLFMLPHLWTPGLPQLHVMAFYFFLMGFLLAIVTVRSNSLEIAFGSHVANNMFAFLVVSCPSSYIMTSSMFTCTELRPLFELATLMIAGMVFYFLVVRFVCPQDAGAPGRAGRPRPGVSA